MSSYIKIDVSHLVWDNLINTALFCDLSYSVCLPWRLPQWIEWILLESQFPKQLLTICRFVLIDVKLINLFTYTACVPPGDDLIGSTGNFSSPNFPNNFSANSNCNWTITVPAGRIIKVTFFSFALHPTHNTNCAGGSGIPHVLITNVASDDAQEEFKICGDRLPDPVYSVGNSIQVRLITGANIYQGFNASYEAIDGKLRKPFLITLRTFTWQTAQTWKYKFLMYTYVICQSFRFIVHYQSQFWTDKPYRGNFQPNFQHFLVTPSQA